jgi:hypothetical protein
MPHLEIEQVLENWIEQALSSSGKLAGGITPARWIAKNFIHWWRPQVDDALGDAESAAEQLRAELVRLNTPAQLGEAFHELAHLQDALGDLRCRLGLDQTSPPTNT